MEEAGGAVSRRQHRVITISVRVPVKVGRTQASTIADVRAALQTLDTAGYTPQEFIIKLLQKEVIYS